MNNAEAVQKLNTSGLYAVMRHDDEIRGSLNLTKQSEDRLRFFEDTFFIIRGNEVWDIKLNLAQVSVHLIQTPVLESAIDLLIACRDFIQTTKL